MHQPGDLLCTGYPSHCQEQLPLKRRRVSCCMPRATKMPVRVWVLSSFPSPLTPCQSHAAFPALASPVARPPGTTTRSSRCPWWMVHSCSAFFFQHNMLILGEYLYRGVFVLQDASHTHTHIHTHRMRENPRRVCIGLIEETASVLTLLSLCYFICKMTLIIVSVLQCCSEE